MFNLSKRNFMDVLNSIDSVYVSFDCDYPCVFLETMADAGYCDFLNIIPESRAKKLGGCGRESYSGIRLSGKDAYANIDIHRNTEDNFGITINIVPGDEYHKNNGKPVNAFVGAVSAMVGK